MKQMRRSACFRRVQSLTLAGALCCLPPSTVAQANLSQASATVPKLLTIEILEGEAELNDVRARTAREPIVQIEDENHKPVAGALVLFSIQSGGGQPAATFSGLANYATRTDAQGRAVAHGFTPTKHAGNFQIHVQALFEGLSTVADIHQTNVLKGSRLSRLTTNHTTLITVLDAAVGAAAISAVLATSRDPSATTVTAGTGTVTAP